MKIFKPDLDPDHLVDRSLSVLWSSPDLRREALRTLNEQPFIQEAGYDETTGQLSLSYDAGQKDIRAIGTLVQQLGGEMPRGWRHRLADLWHAFQDHGTGMHQPLDPDEQVSCHPVKTTPAQRPNWRS